MADAGFRIFPVWGVRKNGTCECNRPNCPSPGKHPISRIDMAPNGVKDATSDRAVVERWWKTIPTANIGWAMGEQDSGCSTFAIDVDKGDGYDATDSFARIVDEYGGLPPTTQSKTGGGGGHYVYAHDTDIHVGNAQDLVVHGEHVKGLDVRGTGGYIVIPPSGHASGELYEWVRDPEHLVSSPPWLLNLVVKGERPDKQRNSFPSPKDDTVTDKKIAEIRSALESIPPNVGRQDWLERVCFPLFQTFRGSERGYQIFLEWSKMAQGLTTPSGKPAYRGPWEIKKTWASCTLKHKNPKDIRTLFQLAFEHGWKGDPALREEIADIEKDRHSRTHENGRGHDEPREPDPEELAAAMANLAGRVQPIPADIVASIKGPIAHLIDWILSCSYRPDEAFALGAALSLCSAALARRVISQTRSRAGIIIVNLGDSGTGKGTPIQCVQNAVSVHPATQWGLVTNSPCHRSQIDASLIANRGRLFLVIDEYDSTARRWLSQREHSEISQLIRQLATCDAAQFHLFEHASGHPNIKRFPRWGEGIVCPHLTILASCTLDGFVEVFNRISLQDGFAGRHLPFLSIHPDGAAPLTLITDGRPDDVPEILTSWLAYVNETRILKTHPKRPLSEAGKPEEGADELKVVPFVPGGAKTMEDRLADLEQRAVDAYHSHAERHIPALLRRSADKIGSISLILACAECEKGPLEAKIEPRHVHLASAIVNWAVSNLCCMFSGGVEEYLPSAASFSRALTRVQDMVEAMDGKRFYYSTIERRKWAAGHLGRIRQAMRESASFRGTNTWAEFRGLK